MSNQIMKSRGSEIESIHHDIWAEAVTEFRNGNLSSALFLFKRLAKDGCTPALVEIGNIYELGGKDVEQDLSLAEQWYQRSVNLQDDPKAHLALGRIRLRNAKTKEDYRRAHEHFSLIEDYDDMATQYCLGLIYEFGLGTQIDLSKATQFYRSAIALGHIMAKKNLARICMKDSLLKGLWLWIGAMPGIIKVGWANPADRRLGI